VPNTNRTRRRGGEEAAARGRDTARANGEIRRDHRRPLPGNTARPHRVREALHDLYILELRRNHKRPRKLSARQLMLLAAAQLEVLQSKFRGLLGDYKRLAPTSRTPVAHKVKRWVEVRAVLALPEVAWLKHYMLGSDLAQPDAPTGRRPGRPADIRYLWVMLWLLVCGRQNKDLFALHEELESPGRIKRWALGDYRLPKVKSVYDAMLSLTGRRDPRAVWHVNVALLRRLASLTDERGRKLHPDIAVYVYGDGKLIESDLPQRPYKGGHHRRAINGKRRARVTFVTYVNSDGEVTTAVRGYKFICLVDLKSTLPVIGGLFPATYDERQAVLELVAELRAMWPQAPVTWFGGDGLYDRSKRFHYEMEFVHGIHPVAQTYNVFSKQNPYHKTKGVPKCRHGWMKREKARFVYDTPWRLRHGQPLSAPLNSGRVMDGAKRATDKAYIVWTCKRGQCETVTTRMRDDIRAHSFAPRDGDSEMASFRQAFLLRRGAVENVFSVLGYFGLGDKAQRRMKWGGDLEMEWVLALACLFMTGRRLAHETGLYTLAYEQAIAKGMLDRPSWGTDSPWPADPIEGEDEHGVTLPQAGVGGPGPTGRRTRGTTHEGVAGTGRMPRRKRTRPRTVRRAHVDQSALQSLLDETVVAEPVSWREYVRRREAANEAAAAQERVAQETGRDRPPVDGRGQRQPDGTAFVDETARRALLDEGEFEFELSVDMQDILDADEDNDEAEAAWDDVATPSIADDDVISVSGSCIDEDAGAATQPHWTERPLEPDADEEEDEKKYVERFRDVDVDKLIAQFGLSVKKNFGIENKYVAVSQVDDLSLTEDLNNPLTLDGTDQDEQPAEAEAAAPETAPDEDKTDNSE